MSEGEKKKRKRKKGGGKGERESSETKKRKKKGARSPQPEFAVREPETEEEPSAAAGAVGAAGFDSLNFFEDGAAEQLEVAEENTILDFAPPPGYQVETGNVIGGLVGAGGIGAAGGLTEAYLAQEAKDEEMRNLEDKRVENELPAKEKGREEEEDGEEGEEEDPLRIITQKQSDELGQALIGVLPDLNYLEVLKGSLDHFDLNMAVALSAQDPELNQAIVSFYFRLVETFGVDFFQKVENGESDAIKFGMVFLLGEYKDQFQRPELVACIRKFYADWLKNFTDTCIGPTFIRKGYQIRGLVYDHNVAHLEMDEKGRNLRQQLLQLIQYESHDPVNGIPVTLCEYVNMFRGYLSMPVDTEQDSPKLILQLARELENASRMSKPYSYVPLELFRKIYRPFFANFMRGVVLFGGENLPASIATLFLPAGESEDSLESAETMSGVEETYERQVRANKPHVEILKNTKGRHGPIFKPEGKPFFRRLIHLYRGWTGLHAFHDRGAFDAKDEIWYGSKPWLALFAGAGRRIPLSCPSVHRDVLNGKQHFNWYATRIKQGLQDLLFLRAVYQRYESEEASDESSSRAHRKTIELFKEDILRSMKSWLMKAWCRHHAIWSKYWRTLVITFPYTKSKKLEEKYKKLQREDIRSGRLLGNEEVENDDDDFEVQRRKEVKELLGPDEGELKTPETIAQEAQQLAEQKMKERMDGKENEVQQTTVSGLRQLEVEVAKATLEAQEQEKKDDLMIRTALLKEKDTSITRTFPPLVIFQSSRDALLYNLDMWSRFARGKAFERNTTVTRISRSKIMAMLPAEEELRSLGIHAEEKTEEKKQVSANEDNDEDEKDGVEEEELKGIDHSSVFYETQADPSRRQQDDNSGLDQKHTQKEKKIRVISDDENEDDDKHETKDLKIGSLSSTKVNAENLLELEALQQWMEIEHLSFHLGDLPLTQGAVYILGVPIQANGKRILAGTRIKLWEYRDISKQNPALLEENASNIVDDSLEVADWYREENQEATAKRTKQLKITEMQSQHDGAIFNMTPEQYQQTEHYRRKMAEVRRRQEELRQLGLYKPQVPVFTVEDDPKTSFLLFPRDFPVKVRKRTFFIKQFPILLGYALCASQLVNKPTFSRLSISVPELKRNPLLLYGMLESCLTEEGVEICAELPTYETQEKWAQADLAVNEREVRRLGFTILTAIQKASDQIYGVPLAAAADDNDGEEKKSEDPFVEAADEEKQDGSNPVFETIEEDEVEGQGEQQGQQDVTDLEERG